ncbi:hypothetical protein A9Q95_07560 [Rhodobacterales bacterium 59_46_T64]|nr:hypothetical protein A9Q95_07560 [Rhodobacterales bacterium 59_46_T64]
MGNLRFILREHWGKGALAQLLALSLGTKNNHVLGSKLQDIDIIHELFSVAGGYNRRCLPYLQYFV